MKTHNTFRLIHFAIVGLIISVIARDYYGLWSAINTDCSLVLCFKHQHSLEFHIYSLALLFFCFLVLESIYEEKLSLWIKNNALVVSIIAFLGIVTCYKQITAQPFEFGIMSSELNEEQVGRDLLTLMLYSSTYIAMILVAFTESKISKQAQASPTGIVPNNPSDLPTT